MNTKRTIVIIPSERDLADPAWRTRYFPNFVWLVKQGIHGAGDCRVVIATESDGSAGIAPSAAPSQPKDL